MGFLGLGGGKKAARIAAKATLDAANMQAASDRENARASIQQMQNMAAQHRASEFAAEILSKPRGQAEVLLSPETEAPAIDPETRRRRTARSQFGFTRPTSGISI